MWGEDWWGRGTDGACESGCISDSVDAMLLNWRDIEKEDSDKETENEHSSRNG